MASNMDTVGTFEMAKELAKVGFGVHCDLCIIFGIFSTILQNELFTAIHKHYTVEEWKEFASQNKDILKVLS